MNNAEHLLRWYFNIHVSALLLLYFPLSSIACLEKFLIKEPPFDDFDFNICCQDHDSEWRF